MGALSLHTIGRLYCVVQIDLNAGRRQSVVRSCVKWDVLSGTNVHNQDPREITARSLGRFLDIIVDGDSSFLWLEMHPLSDGSHQFFGFVLRANKYYVEVQSANVLSFDV